MSARTRSLAEVAAMVCDDELKDPELWLLRRVRSGKASALRISRGHYRFTQQQVDDLLASLDTGRKPERAADPVAVPTGRPTSASLRRRMRSVS